MLYINHFTRDPVARYN